MWQLYSSALRERMGCLFSLMAQALECVTLSWKD
jgi:hypothetical protein